MAVGRPCIHATGAEVVGPLAGLARKSLPGSSAIAWPGAQQEWRRVEAEGHDDALGKGHFAELIACTVPRR